MHSTLSQFLAVGLVVLLIGGVWYQHPLNVKAEERKKVQLVHRTCVFTDPLTGRKHDPCMADREAEKLWKALFRQFASPTHLRTE